MANKRIYELPDAGAIDNEQRFPVEIVGGGGGTKRQTIGRILHKAQQTAGLKPWTARIYAEGECAIVDGLVKQFQPIGSNGSEFYPEEWVVVGKRHTEYGYPDYDPDEEYFTNDRITFANRLYRQTGLESCTGVTPLQVPLGATFWTEVSISEDRFGRDYDAALADDGYEVVGLKDDVVTKMMQSGAICLFKAIFSEQAGASYVSTSFMEELLDGDWIKVGGIAESGPNHIIVELDGSESDNYLRLKGAYEFARIHPPASGRFSLLMTPGVVSLPEDIVFDEAHIDVAGISDSSRVVFIGTGHVVVAADVTVSGLDLGENRIIVVADNATIRNCKAGAFSFEDFEGDSTGNYYDCIGGIRCFGSQRSYGRYERCGAHSLSFGNGAEVLAGKLISCTLESGTFQTVSGAGRTYFCIDGDGDINNQ